MEEKVKNSSVRVRYRITSLSGAGDTKTIEKDFILSADISDFPKVSCPNSGCTSDGFNLMAEILAAVRTGMPRTGVLHCKGKEDRRYMKNRTGFSCESKLEYTITPIP